MAIVISSSRCDEEYRNIRPVISALITLVLFVSLLSVKAKFRYAIWSQTGSKLVADLQRAEICPII